MNNSVLPSATQAASDLAIDARLLTKVYSSRISRRRVRAVDGISLQVAAGITFGLLGPNGAGKTTFVKMLLSAVRPTSGSVYLFGRDAKDAPARRPVGYLPENHRFPTYLTGSGMLDFYGALSGMESSARRRRIPELLALTGLDNWGSVRIGKYSKGMLQRLGLAQALMHQPSLLILDEPTDGVDPVGRRQIREILTELERRGVTIFINSHQLAEVELFCREVAILERGRLALSGAVKDLTVGKGFKLTAVRVPDPVRAQLNESATAVWSSDGVVGFQFADRAAVNRAIDLLRAATCEIQSLEPAASTLEDVFVRTIHG